MRRSTLALVAGALALATSALAACSGTAAEDDSVAGSEQGLASNVHVLTSRNDVARTGANLAEKVLTASNVGGTTFGKLFTRNLDGQVYAQPLYVGGVNGKNLVYVATEHNTVYAFDADDLRVTAPPVWQKNFGPSVPAADTGCGLLTPEIGITSTPVIDLVAKTVWFTAKTKENGTYVHRLHALDIANGLERANSPVLITASAPGSGAGSVGGIVTMDPLRHMNRPGLLKTGSSIYLGFAS
jgi:outer membrane protein assembly factor BamB